jgi:glycine cleavage system H protein
MKRYSEDHQWVEVRKGTAAVGITAFAAEELGEITFIELPEIGTVVTQGDSLCIVESVKAASDVFAPISGTVAEVNQQLDENPALINDSPERDGWVCRLKEIDESELDELMSESEYEAFAAGGEGVEEDDEEEGS